jgi:hypothetical protein
MTWLIILVVLLAAFGPIMWLVPSRRDRRLAAMRQQARTEGMTVEIRRLPKVDPLPEERVTAGGRVLQPVQELAVYQWPLSRRLRCLPTWRVLRHSEGLPALPGWAFEIGKKPQHPQLDAALEVLGPLFSGLREDVLAVECEDRQLDAYWLEGPDSGPSDVTQIARLLASGAQALEALERELEAQVEEGNI